MSYAKFTKTYMKGEIFMEEKKKTGFIEAIAFIIKHKNLFIALGIFVIVFIIALTFMFPKEREFSVVAESSLKEIVDKNELSTVEYTYNSVVSVPDEKNKIKYHVKYKGKVWAGFEFDKIDVRDDKTNKKLIVVIPEIKINNASVESEGMDFIFLKDLKKEGIIHEAYSACEADLLKKTEDNATIKQIAYENAENMMKAIMKPIEEQLPEEYEVVYQKGSAE